MDNKKPKPQVRPFSFKEGNFDCLEHLDKQFNKSEYICQLIRLDMEYDVLRNRDKLANLDTDDKFKLDSDSTFDF